MNKFILNIGLNVIFFILTLLIIFIEKSNISFDLSSISLLIIFLIITFIFDKFVIKSHNQENRIILVNFNFPLIFLTNPLISLLYSFGYSVIQLLKLKNKKDITFLLNSTSKNFLSTYANYYIIFYFTKSHVISLTPILLLIMFLSFAFSNVIERLISLIYLFLRNKRQEHINYKEDFLTGIVESWLISLFVFPLIIKCYDLANYSGLLYPFGLILVITYTFHKSLDKQKKLEEFKEMSYKDALTGVYNRRYLEEYLDSISSVEEPMAILMLDIDKFKSVNDNYNHNVGDQVLKHFANVLNKCIRSHDVVARYGGEEFTIILKNLTPEQAKMAAERIRGSVELSFAVVNFEGETKHIKYTTSVGLFYSHAQRSYNLKLAQKEADQLLYMSKHSGRNRITANI